MEVVGRMNESSNIETEDVYTAHNHKKFNSFCIADILQLESRETSPREKLIVRPWDDCRKSPFHVRGGGDFLPSSADCPPADPVDCQRNPLTSLYLMMINSNHPRRTQTTQLEPERNLLQNSCPFASVRSYHSPVYIRNFLKKRRKTRTAFTNQQLIQLEKRFRFQKYLTPADRDEVASSLNLSNSQVITWFQNRRAKLKRDMEELKADMNAAKILGNNCSSLTKLEEFFQSNCHKKKC